MNSRVSGQCSHTVQANNWQALSINSIKTKAFNIDLTGKKHDTQKKNLSRYLFYLSNTTV